MNEEVREITWLSVREELNVCRQSNGSIDYDRYRSEDCDRSQGKDGRTHL